LLKFKILGVLDIFDGVESISTIKNNHQKHDSNMASTRFFEIFLPKFLPLLAIQEIPSPC